MDLSIIIVNYNTYEYTKAAVESVLNSEEKIDGRGFNYEILLIDNASHDESFEKLSEDFESEPRVQLIQNDQNLGFSKGNNIGLEKAKGDYLLLLNSDTEIEPDALVKTVSFMKENPRVGAVGGCVRLGNGELDHACKRSFPTPENALYHMLGLDKKFPKHLRFGAYSLTYLPEDQISEIDCTTGAYMCVSRKAYELTGGLDPDYFMYGEDIDWCYRIKQAGFQIIYFPDAHITHYKKVSWTGKRNPKVLDAFYDSMNIFYDKHYGSQYSPVVRFAVKSGTNMMKMAAHLKNQFK